MNYSHKRYLGAVSALALSWLVPTVFAQSAPETDETETVILSEFRVDTTRDTGYRATNSVSATLLNTPLRDTPFAIDVYNEDFIRDIGATNFREVLLYDSRGVIEIGKVGCRQIRRRSRCTAPRRPKCHRSSSARSPGRRVQEVRVGIAAT